MTNRLEIHNLLVLSLQHVPKHDRATLCGRKHAPTKEKGEAPEYRVIPALDDNSITLWTGGGDWSIEEVQEYEYSLTDEGLSEDLVAVLRFAREQGCSYVRLDLDGPVCEHLPTF